MTRPPGAAGQLAAIGNFKHVVHKDNNQGELTEYMHEHTRKSQLEAFGLRRQRICLCGSLVNSRLRTEISEHVLVDYVGEP
eukprot:1158110-Pelagomonas_calceolata.AAC.9